jgi:hypothetical protein
VRALATSRKRIWSAKNRVPRLTGRGTSGSRKGARVGTGLACWAHDRLLELIEVAQRTVPTVIVFTLNIFR